MAYSTVDLSKVTRFRRMAAVTGILLLPNSTTEPSASTPVLTVGTGVPTENLPNGSIAIRTDAPSAGVLFYVRVGGAWDLAGNPFGAQIDYAELGAALAGRIPSALPVPFGELDGVEALGAAAAAEAAAIVAAALDATTKANAAQAASDPAGSAATAQAAAVVTANAYTDAAVAGIPVLTLPTVVDSRWTQAGLQEGLVYADHDFPTVASLVSSPESATIYNSARFSILSSGSGIMTLRPDATATDMNWYHGTYTAGHMLWSLGLKGFIECHMRTADAASVGNQVITRIIVREKANPPGNEKWASVYMSAGSVRSVGSGAFHDAQLGVNGLDSPTITPSVADLNTGFWFRLEVDGSGTVRAFRVAGAAASRPKLTDYVALYQGTALFAGILSPYAPLPLEVGLVQQRTAAAAGGNDSMIVSGLRIGRALAVPVSA